MSKKVTFNSIIKLMNIIDNNNSEENINFISVKIYGDYSGCINKRDLVTNLDFDGLEECFSILTEMKNGCKK